MQFGKAVRPRVLAGVMAALAVACASCSDGDEPAEHDQDADAVVVAAAAIRLGPGELVLDAELAERQLFVLYRVNGGLDAATAACATAGFVESFGGRTALEGVPMAELLSEDTQRARRDAARACEPEPEGPTSTVDPFEPPEPEQLPDDLDATELRDHLVELTAASARAIGMDQSEASCFATASYGELDDEQVLATLRPEAYPDVELPERTGAAEVRSCLTPERVTELADRWRDELSSSGASGDPSE